MAEVIQQAPKEHHCNPGWELHYSEGSSGPAPLPAGWYWHDLHLPAGTVVRCECGKVWVAEDQRTAERRTGIHTTGVWFGVTWRPEKRHERRRRKKKECS